jgi:hypothetical protein
MKIDFILDCLGRCDAGHSWLAFPDLASRKRAEFGKETATPSLAGATLYCIARGKASSVLLANPLAAIQKLMG